MQAKKNTKEESVAARDYLYDALLSLQSRSECAAFLRDICTLTEINSLTERLQVAKLLRNNTSYRSISDELGVSTTTVSRVAHWVHHGMGGYHIVLPRIK